MRSQQRANYAERIDRAVRFIEERTRDGEIPDLAELASIAALSEYHFHRMFRVMTGESPAAAVTRIRLGHSLPALASEGIGAATARSGYATSQAYARALRATAGASPTELRGDAGRRNEAERALARPERSEADPVALTIEVVSFEPLRLLTYRNIGAYAELNSGYGRLLELLSAQLDPDAIEGIYGLPHDDPRDTPANDCRFTCAFATGTAGAAQGEMVEQLLAGGRHAAMHWQGDFDAIHDAIDALYVWAAETGEMIAAAPLFIHYLDDPDEVPPEDQRAVIYLPLCDGDEQ